MRGQIIKRSKKKNSDSYSLVISWKDEDTGKYKKKWIVFHGTKPEAEQELTRLLHERDRGIYFKPGKITFAELLNKWLQDYVFPNLAPRTAEGYQGIVDVHLIPALGKIPLSKLTPSHIQSFYAEKLKSNRLHAPGLISANTVRHFHMAIHGALQMGMKWGLVSRNVADAVDPPRCQKASMQIMNEEDIHVILEATKQTEYYPIFYLAIYSGMRRSELLALRWSDVDLLGMQISVNRALHQLKDGSIIFRQPKTAKGRRLVALPPSAALLLRQHKEEQNARKILTGDTLKESDLVFSDFDYKPILPDHITQAWRRLARKVGLKNIRLHDARHTFASLMLKNNVHPAIVQQMLGHASIQITIDTYSHIMPGIQQAAANKFDELLEKKERIPSNT